MSVFRVSISETRTPLWSTEFIWSATIWYFMASVSSQDQDKNSWNDDS